MKNLIVSVAVGLLSGFTVYLLIDYLFERPSKNVKPSDFEEIEPEDIIDESSDNTIPLKKAETATN